MAQKNADTTHVCIALSRERLQLQRRRQLRLRLSEVNMPKRQCNETINQSAENELKRGLPGSAQLAQLSRITVTCRHKIKLPAMINQSTHMGCLPHHSLLLTLQLHQAVSSLDRATGLVLWVCVCVSVCVFV